MSKDNLLGDIDYKLFYAPMTKHLENNINAIMRKKVSVLLAIDYKTRLNEEPKIKEYADNCTYKLQKHLQYKVVLKENFSTTISLFTVAIAPEIETNNDEKDKLQQQSQDAAISAVIAEHFSNLSQEEQKSLRGVVRQIINAKSGKEIMDLIISDPKLFYSNYLAAAKAKKKEKEAAKVLVMHLVQVMKQKKIITKKSHLIKGAISKIAVFGGILAGAALGALIGGFTIPALVSASAIGVSRFGSLITEKTYAAIEGKIPSIKNAKRDLKSIELIEVSKEKFTAKKNILKKRVSKEKAASLTKAAEINVTKVQENSKKAQKTPIKKLKKIKAKTQSRSLN